MFYIFIDVQEQIQFLQNNFTSKLELLEGNELLYNILPKLSACCLRLINLTLFNLKSGFCLIMCENFLCVLLRFLLSCVFIYISFVSVKECFSLTIQVLRASVF